MRNRIPGADTEVFATVWIPVLPQVAKPDLLDRVHVMRRRVDPPYLVEISATGIEVADDQRTVTAPREKGGDQRFPIRIFASRFGM